MHFRKSKRMKIRYIGLEVKPLEVNRPEVKRSEVKSVIPNLLAIGLTVVLKLWAAAPLGATASFKGSLELCIRKKSHTIAEHFILPAAVDMVNLMITESAGFSALAVMKSKYRSKINVEKKGCFQFNSTIWENMRRSTGSFIPLIIVMQFIESVHFSISLTRLNSCFVNHITGCLIKNVFYLFYLTIHAKKIIGCLYFAKVHLLKFGTWSLGKMWG